MRLPAPAVFARLLALAALFGAFARLRAEPASLEAYPLAEELAVATVVVEVQPVRAARLKAPFPGLLSLHLPPAGRRLPEGAVWAEFDPDRLKLEADAIRLARDLLAEKEKPRQALELARNAADLASRRSEIARQLDMLARISADPALAELYARPAPADLPAAADPAPAATDEIPALVERLRRQAALIDEVLLHAGTPRETELEFLALDLKLRAQELDLARRLEEQRLVMPFEGEITLVPPAPPAGRPLRVETGAELALVQDFSAIQAVMPVRRAEWRMFDPARLELRHADRGRRVLAARFERAVLRQNLGREELAHVFKFPDDQRASARPLAGGQVSMRLVLRLDRPARVVPKLDLVLAAPAVFRERGWEAGVEAVHPGARVLAIGETHVALAPPAP